MPIMASQVCLVHLAFGRSGSLLPLTACSQAFLVVLSIWLSIYIVFLFGAILYYFLIFENILGSFLISSILVLSLNLDPSTERKNLISAAWIRLKSFFLISRPYYNITE